MNDTHVAIGQLRMHWSIEENMAEITRATRFAAGQGAQLCVFPELATTGFHRRIVEHAFAEKMQPQVATLARLASELRVAISAGAPTFEDGKRFNSQLMIDEAGSVSAVPKNGLTAPEATFFEAGAQRPIALMHGLRTSAVICREIEDHDIVREQLESYGVDLLLWPGQMRPDPEKPPQDPPAYVVQAQALARSLRCFIVQANWPNALNRPEESAGCGHSAMVSPDGELLHRLPKEGNGIGVFDMADGSCEWFPA